MKQKPAVKKTRQPETKGRQGWFSWQLTLIVGSIMIVTYACYTPSLKNLFIDWDDNGYVFENVHLGKPLSEAIQYFFEPHYFIGNYIPITMSVYAVEYHIAGYDAAFFHSINLFFHLLNVLLVFWFIYLLSNKKNLVAAIVALLFGVHPMHVESVAWIAELKDVLYSTFFLGGLIAYLSYSNSLGKEEKNTSKHQTNFKLLAITFFLFVLSLLSKPSAIVFPLVLFSIDYYKKRKFNAVTLLEKIPFFIISLIFGIIAIVAQQSDNLIHDYYPWYERLLFACHSVLNYIVKMFLPVNQSIYYPYPNVENGHLPYPFYVAPVALIALIYGIFKSLKHTRLLVFGFIFYLINLVLVLQVLSFGDAIIAERYTYISYIGLFFILAMGFDSLYYSTKPTFSSYKNLITGTLTVFIIACSYITYARCQVWENDETIAIDLLEKFPNDRLALNNRGFNLYTHGQYQEAIKLFNKAIAQKPDYAMAYINLTNAYMAIHDTVDAVATTNQALKIAPHNYDVLNTKGYLTCIKGNYVEGAKYYRESVSLRKENIKAYLSLATCYFNMQDYDNWIQVIEDGLKVDPYNPFLLNNRGYSLQRQGKYIEAIPYFNAALKSKPDFTTATVNLKDCYRALGDTARGKR